MFGAIRRLAFVAIAWFALTTIVGLALANRHYGLELNETFEVWDRDFWLPFRMSCIFDPAVACLELTAP